MAFASVEQLLERRVAVTGRDGDDALMVDAAGEILDLGSWHHPDGNPERLRPGDGPRQARLSSRHPER